METSTISKKCDEQWIKNSFFFGNKNKYTFLFTYNKVNLFICPNINISYSQSWNIKTSNLTGYGRNKYVISVDMFSVKDYIEYVISK